MQELLKEKKECRNRLIIGTVISLVVAVVLVIAMEAMIYNIYMKAYKASSEVILMNPQRTIAYVDDKKEDGKYRVYYYNYLEEFDTGKWTSNLITESDLKILPTQVKEVKDGAPSAFVISITPVHYVVITIFIGLVAGFFTYKFIRLEKDFQSAKKEVLASEKEQTEKTE